LQFLRDKANRCHRTRFSEKVFSWPSRILFRKIKILIGNLISELRLLLPFNIKHASVKAAHLREP
jgi:hypothetical protein